MANTIGYGQGAVNNTNGFGKAPTNNTIDFGEVCADSWSPETNLVGGSSFSNTQSTEYDGIDAYVSLNTISLTSAFSISAWVKFSTLASAESHIINTGTSNTNRIGVYSSTAFQVKIAGTNVFISETGGNDFVTNQWQHVLITRDASNNVNVFRNGSSFGSSTTLSGTLTLDSIFRFNTSQYALGYCDELAIWDSDQSANASTFGASPVDLSTYSPLHWYRFEGTGTTATDSGSGGNNGTLNGVTRSTDVPT